MRTKSMQQTLVDAAVVSQLACPVCLGELQLSKSCLDCGRCGRSYPIVDGIPVLIAERASGPDPC
ncbi:MAG: Trm112 family protein [Terracidiphilus sp.]